MHSDKGKAHRTDENVKIVKDAAGKKTNPADKKGRIIRLSENGLSPADKPVEGKLAAGLSPEDIVFALDIGTRTVVGVVGIQEDQCFRIIATEVIEHKNRAMMDGQIHDIEQVAATAAGVKSKLESRLGVKLKKVAIAAAGRVLKTCQVRVEKNIEPVREIDAEFVSSLEIEGIQRAQMILDEETASEDKTQFYCVGYSVINYYLNGYVISKLTGHKGKNVGADVLATFLPLIVVDSLYTVMSKIGLEVSSLTLEPIAAINVTIPADLRLLNLALVDIGAGTSDIALTKDGSVIAYAMVPVAGDEITEKISQHYLVDFNTGEKIKIALSSNKDKIIFTDILKKKHSVSPADVMKAIEGTLQLLSTTISQRIMEYNHKAPNAIFLVGGGCRVPGLSEMIAHEMELPADRVVVRGRDVIRDIKFSDKKLYGPESITPYGIAVTAQMYGGKDFLTVTVNDRKIKLFNSKKLTVADALILFGFDASQLIGRTGKGISYHLNGERKKSRGEYGKAAEIYVNGKPASIDTAIAYGDNLKVIPSQDGRDILLRAYELAPSGYSTGIVRLNGNPVDISTLISVNGRQVSKDTKINDGDDVQVSQIMTLEDLLDAGGLDSANCEIYVNKSPNFDMNYLLNSGDDIICSDRTEELQADKHAVSGGWPGFSENGKGREEFDTRENTPQIAADEVIPEIEQVQHVSDMNQPQNAIQVIVNGQSIALKGGRSQYIFVDVFNYFDFDLTKPKGTIVLSLNGQQAAFTDIIKSGDVIGIYWKG
jgi:cell division protein FtsA